MRLEASGLTCGAGFLGESTKNRPLLVESCRLRLGTLGFEGETMSESRIEISCGCGCDQFTWDEPLTDSTVMTCTACGRSATRKAIVSEAVRQAKPEIERALKQAFRGL